MIQHGQERSESSFCFVLPRGRHKVSFSLFLRRLKGSTTPTGKKEPWIGGENRKSVNNEKSENNKENCSTTAEINDSNIPFFRSFCDSPLPPTLFVPTMWASAGGLMSQAPASCSEESGWEASMPGGTAGECRRLEVLHQSLQKANLHFIRKMHKSGGHLSNLIAWISPASTQVLCLHVISVYAWAFLVSLNNLPLNFYWRIEKNEKKMYILESEMVMLGTAIEPVLWKKDGPMVTSGKFFFP